VALHENTTSAINVRYQFTGSFGDAVSLHCLDAAVVKRDEWDLPADNTRSVIFFIAHIATQITRQRPWSSQQFVTADYPQLSASRKGE